MRARVWSLVLAYFQNALGFRLMSVASVAHASSEALLGAIYLTAQLGHPKAQLIIITLRSSLVRCLSSFRHLTNKSLAAGLE